MAKYGIQANERNRLYQNLIACIQHDIAVSEYLSAQGVSSILRFSNIEKLQDEDGAYHIFMETDHVKPVTESILSKSIFKLDLLDVIYRLSIILRDISKMNTVHRGFELTRVYENDRHRLLLGGFYYSYCPGLEYPMYLPTKSPNLPTDFLRGDRGDQGLDIQSLCVTAWNLLSGHAFNARLDTDKMVMPEFADQELVDILQLGLSGETDSCNSFRRKLLEYRKKVSKSELANQQIPVYRLRLKQYDVEIV